ncbi:MAG: methyltransferase domain-containing protein [Verrucomicrobia bacterium]|jgi:ubiquinone/menaquinone biosynthesis C-methylase UbiE|nr:methyltransferase domain-containing protein [Verrucomicrobiota bacterium]
MNALTTSIEGVWPSATAVAMPKNRVAEYYDAIAMDYDSLYGDVFSQVENSIIADRLSEIVQSGDRILDLGCGTGLGRSLLGQGVQGLHYNGLDLSERMIACARQKHRNVSDSSFLIGDMTDLSMYPEDSFDCVISLFGSFSHVPNPTEAGKEMWRVCAPGGRILIMTYSRFSMRNLFDFQRTLSSGGVPSVGEYSIRNSGGQEISSPAHFYTPSRVKSVFEDFDEVSVSGLNAVFELNSAKVSARALKLGFASVKRTMLFEQVLLSRLPGLAHSLVVQGVKTC